MVCPEWENFGLGISDFGLGISDFGVALLLPLVQVKHWYFKCGIPIFYILQLGTQGTTEIRNPQSEIPTRNPQYAAASGVHNMS